MGKSTPVPAGQEWPGTPQGLRSGPDWLCFRCSARSPAGKGTSTGRSGVSSVKIN